MDFNYSEEQEAVRQLSAQICGERSTHERLKQVEAEAGDKGPIDRELWRELAGAAAEVGGVSIEVAGREGCGPADDCRIRLFGESDCCAEPGGHRIARRCVWWPSESAHGREVAVDV